MFGNNFRISKILIVFLALFAFSFANNANAQSIIRDAEIENLVRSYSDPLFIAAGLEPKDVRIYLVNDKSLNAFVTDGQKLFIHTGLILEAKNPNQLKGVIAHETGHIAGGHLARSSEAMRNAMVPAYVSIALGLIAIASGAGDAGAALLASSQQFAILNFYSYTRIQESSADQAALTYLEATHQSGKGIIEFFEKFRSMEVMVDERMPPYFRSHPLSSQRITALISRATHSEYYDNSDDAQTNAEFEMAKAKIHGFLYTSEQTFYRYPPSDQSLPARYARAIAFYRAPDLVVARNIMNGLIAEQPNNPYFQELMGQILYEHGKINESIPFFQKSTILAPNETLLHLGYARALIGNETNNNYDLAETELRTAIRLEPDNAFAWNQLAIVADRQGKAGMARLATAEEAFALGDIQRANRFAQAARRNLERSSPGWQRASDIVTSTDADVARIARQRPN